MPFEKGKSGNPNGRPRGAIGRKHAQLTALIESRAEELVTRAIEMALLGDGQMLKLCIDKIYPSLKPRDLPEIIPLPPITKNTAATARNILKSVQKGDITMDEAKDVINMLSSTTKITEITEMEKMMAEIKKSQENR